MNKNRLSVAEAARRLGVSPQCIRIGLERGTFKFGCVVRMKRNVYIIYRSAFEAETGLKGDADGRSDHDEADAERMY